MWKSPRCNVVGFRAYRMIERDMLRNLFMIQKSIFHVSVIATVLLIPLVADAEQGREMLARGDFESVSPETAIGELWAAFFDGQTQRAIAVRREFPLATCRFDPNELEESWR